MMRLGRFARSALPLTAILVLAACARSYPPAPVDYRSSQAGSGPVTRAPAMASSQPGAVQVASASTGVARPQTHRVQKGETLYSIARRYGVDNGALVRANNLPPPYRLEVGQTLNIPGGAPQPVAAPVETAATPAAPRTTVAAPVAIPTDGIRRGGIESAPLAAPGRTSAAPPAAVPEAAPVQASRADGARVAPIAPAPETASPAPKADPVTASAEPVKVPPRPASPVIEASASAGVTGSRALSDPEIGLPARGGRSFQWPVRGQIVSDFGAKAGGLQNDGINIAAPAGTAVRAAENGVVVYAGNEVRGFGNLLLIRHADGWMTAYAHVDEMLVARDAQVRRGQIIAKVGRTGNVTAPQLHFEIRRGTRSVNPREFLLPETASLN